MFLDMDLDGSAQSLDLSTCQNKPKPAVTKYNENAHPSFMLNHFWSDRNLIRALASTKPIGHTFLPLAPIPCDAASAAETKPIGNAAGTQPIRNAAETKPIGCNKCDRLRPDRTAVGAKPI